MVELAITQQLGMDLQLVVVLPSLPCILKVILVIGANNFFLLQYKALQHTKAGTKTLTRPTHALLVKNDYLFRNVNNFTNEDDCDSIFPLLSGGSEY